MRSQWKHRLLIGVMCVIAMGGCNPISMLYFMFGPDPEAKVPPEYPLVSKDKKELKILILTSAPIDLPIDFIGADRLIASKFIQAMNASIKEKKEKITIIPTAQVDKYKQDHPNWRARNPGEIGEHFQADFVINFEILELRLFQPGSNKQLLQGYTRIMGSAYDLTKPNQEPKDLDEYNLEFPKSSPIPVEGNESVSRFRQRFIQQIALELSWKFTTHQLRDKISGGNQLLD